MRESAVGAATAFLRVEKVPAQAVAVAATAVFIKSRRLFKVHLGFEATKMPAGPRIVKPSRTTYRFRRAGLSIFLYVAIFRARLR